ncbi:MAG: DUF1013 domain-containing protein [Holosporales bacterium]|nr:DUF1013 domain-containing protein [Holosporales bacterium]
MTKPLMPKATAIWLVENTCLTFEQIAKFCGLHTLEVETIANEEFSMNGFDPVASSQLTLEEIKRCEEDPSTTLTMKPIGEVENLTKTKKSKYTPLARRKDKPNAILWIIKYYPNLSDSKICSLLGTTRLTVQSIRNKIYWNYKNLEPHSPIILGFCTKDELDCLTEKYTEASKECGF